MSDQPGNGGPFEAMNATMKRALETVAKLKNEEVEIATTPKDAVYRNGKVTMYHYRPLAPRELRTPVLITYGLIGRYTMLDLQPDRSVIRNLLERGIDVFVMDWGEPNRSDRWLRIDDYVEDYIDGAVRELCRLTGVDQVSLFGVCEGGVFACCYAALHPERIANLAVAVTPIDFHADREEDALELGYINRWARNLPSETIEAFIESYGQLPGFVQGMMFQEMTPAQTATKYNWSLPDALGGPEPAVLNFLRMEKWLSDRPHHPAEAAKQWMVELYRKNRLARNEFSIDGQPVRLRSLTMPILNVFARKDHIIPPATSRALGTLSGSPDYQELELSVGHIGTFVSRKANRLFSDTLATWLYAKQPNRPAFNLMSSQS